MTYRPTALTRGILARAERPIPRFGSPEWDALPEHDLRRVAAILIAAEAWRDHCSAERVAEDLVDELVRDDDLLYARIGQAAHAVRLGIPTLVEHPWWVRVVEAERAAQADARAHWDEFNARTRGRR